jgi:hypothetical protein
MLFGGKIPPETAKSCASNRDNEDAAPGFF